MLPKSLKLAIEDCESYPHGYFTWRPKAMKKLEKLGYARQIPHTMRIGIFAWEITDEGRMAVIESINAGYC